jgi:hypothetical protein
MEFRSLGGSSGGEKAQPNARTDAAARHAGCRAAVAPDVARFITTLGNVTEVYRGRQCGMALRKPIYLTTAAVLTLVGVCVLVMSKHPAIEASPTQAYSEFKASSRSEKSHLNISSQSVEAQNDLRIKAPDNRVISPAAPTSIESDELTTFVPGKDWKNVGNATPAAALETYLWAATNGEAESLEGLLEFSNFPGGKSFFDSLSEENRAKYGTPKKVAALMIASDAKAIASISGVVIVGAGAGGTVLRANYLDTEGRPMEQFLWFRQSPDGWRVDVNDKYVAEFLSGDRRRPVFFRKN